MNLFCNPGCVSLRGAGIGVGPMAATDSMDQLAKPLGGPGTGGLGGAERARDPASRRLSACVASRKTQTVFFPAASVITCSKLFAACVTRPNNIAAWRTACAAPSSILMQLGEAALRMAAPFARASTSRFARQSTVDNLLPLESFTSPTDATEQWAGIHTRRPDR